MAIKTIRVQIAKTYAAALAKNHAGASADPGDFHYAFADAILEKKVYSLSYLANGLNDTGKRIFSQVTGVDLPKTQGATWDRLLAWGGVSKEQDNKNQSWNRVRNERDWLIKRLLGGRDMNDSLDIQIQAVIKWVDLQVEAGFNELKTVQRKNYLVNAEGAGFNLSRHGTGMSKAIPYIKAKIAYEAARNTLLAGLAGQDIAGDAEPETCASPSP